jgi:hypothetical protein
MAVACAIRRPIKGARAVGSAGGTAKFRYAREGLGLDDCVDHRDPG